MASVDSSNDDKGKDKDKGKEEVKIENKKEDENTADKELTEQGRSLIQALKDPTKAKIVVKYLADQYGFVEKPLETKADVKEVKNSIIEDLKESLGPEFDILADKLGPGIEKILNKRLEESQKDIRQQFQNAEAEKLKVQSVSAFDKITEDFYGKGEVIPDNVMNEMSKYMDRVPPTLNASPKEYLEDAFHTAIGKLGIVKPNKGKSDRINSNRNDAASRLNGTSDRVPAEDHIRVDNSRPLSRQDAIRAAIEAVEKG